MPTCGSAIGSEVGVLLEEAIHLEQWDQTLTLLWFEDEEVPQLCHDIQKEEDDECGNKGIRRNTSLAR